MNVQEISRPRRFAALAFVIAALALLTGCSFSAPHMHPTTATAITADPAAATVVFVRPSRLGGAITSVIATTEGRFLGESEAKSYFVTKLPPGEHLLVSWSESTPALRAMLSAGMIYYVEVAPKMGFGSARIQLLAHGPRREGWAKMAEWMADCSAIAPDEAAGQAHLKERAADFADRVKAAERSYQGYDAAEREARTLKPDDGVPRAIGGGRGAASAAPKVGGPTIARADGPSAQD